MDRAVTIRCVVLVWVAVFCGCGESSPSTPADAAAPEIVGTSDALDAGVSAVADSESAPTTDAWFDVGDLSVPEPPPTVPDSLGGGFIELTQGIEGWPPFEVDPGVAEERLQPEVTYGIFADLDGDGAVEVVVSGAADGETIRRAVYRYDADTEALVEIPNPVLSPGGSPIWEDLDGDGYRDLILARIGDYAIRWGHATQGFAGTTKLAPDEILGDVERTAFQLMDLDRDGWLDILMRGECGLLVLMRTGVRSFTLRPEMLQGYETATPYAIGLWQVPDKAPVVMVLGHAQCGFYVGLALEGMDAEGYPLFEPIELYDGLAGGDGGDLTGLVSNAPMASAVSDLNGDGALDLFVSLDPEHAIFDGASGWPVSELMPDSGLYIVDSDTEVEQLPWGVALLDLDRDGRDDVLTAHGDDRSRFEGIHPSAGPQWMTAHWNGGNFRFADATERLGLGQRGAWRTLSVGDLDGDHAPDLILGGLGVPPLVYLNRIITPNRGFALRLEGRVSNLLGVGAEVVVTPDGSETSQRYLVGGMASPKVFSNPTLYPGIGAASSATVTVHWPSGITQTVTDLGPDALHVITEPDVLQVAPFGRHVDVGGDEVATLTIRPQSPATSVTVAITHGDGIPSAAEVAEDGSWIVTVAPPPTPGFARLEVRIDGQPLAVYPRLWWDAP
ncbi:MAG: CRTAC1 family protein [Myxococcota bacterium]